MPQIYPLVRRTSTASTGVAKVSFAVTGTGQAAGAQVGAAVNVDVWMTGYHAQKTRALVNISRGFSNGVHFISGEIKKPPSDDQSKDQGTGRISVTIGNVDNEDIPIGYGGPPDSFGGGPPVVTPPQAAPQPQKK